MLCARLLAAAGATRTPICDLARAHAYAPRTTSVYICRTTTLCSRDRCVTPALRRSDRSMTTAAVRKRARALLALLGALAPRSAATTHGAVGRSGRVMTPLVPPLPLPMMRCWRAPRSSACWRRSLTGRSSSWTRRTS
jgi:hypothetical protein